MNKLYILHPHKIWHFTIQIVQKLKKKNLFVRPRTKGFGATYQISTTLLQTFHKNEVPPPQK